MRKKHSASKKALAAQQKTTPVADKGKMDKAAVLDYASHPHIFRSILTFLPPNELATILRTSRQTGKDAGDLLYRTVFLDLGGDKKHPKRPTPLLPATVEHSAGRIALRKNVWVSARVLAQKKSSGVDTESSSAHHPNTKVAAPNDARGDNTNDTPKSTFPGDLVSLLRSTRIIETGPHDSDSCLKDAGKTSPLSHLRIWRFRPGQDRDEMIPRRPGDGSWGRCGTGHMYTVKGCSGPTKCSLARHLNPTHMVVLLSKHWTICPINDPSTFLTLPALGEMSSAVRKLSVTLPANQVLSDRDYGRRWPVRSEAIAISSTIHLTHLELILAPDRSGHFDFKGFNRTALPDDSTLSPLATYLLRLRDTIVKRLCDTECHIRLIGFEFIELSWLATVDTLAPAPSWSFEEEIRCAFEASHVPRETAEEQGRARQARQDRLSFTTLREYALSVEASDTLGEQEVAVLRLALQLLE